MDGLLLSEQEYSEYLEKRDKAPTPTQLRQLRNIDRAAFALDYYSELDGKVLDNTARILRNRQREILSSERETPLESLLSVVPDEVKLALQENNF